MSADANDPSRTEPSAPEGPSLPEEPSALEGTSLPEGTSRPKELSAPKVRRPQDQGTPVKPPGPEAHADVLLAGRVGRAHGLDGSFYVTAAKPRLLELGATVRAGGQDAKIVRRAGTDDHPLVRLHGIEDRGAAEALRGADLTVDLAEAPSLQEGEWWAGELEGCAVTDGPLRVGTVVGLVELPSCEALEVRLESTVPGEDASRAPELLVPMVREAIRSVDPVARRIDVNMGFLEELL